VGFGDRLTRADGLPDVRGTPRRGVINAAHIAIQQQSRRVLN